MNHHSCPCCSTTMLRHLSNRRSFWFCNHCRLEIPDSNKKQIKHPSPLATFNSSSLKDTILKDTISAQKSVNAVPAF